MYSRFAAAVLPDRHRVLGVRLDPLRLGHILLLTRLGNPLVTGAARVDDSHLASAVLVCSRGYIDAVADVSAGWRRPWAMLRLAWLTIRAHFSPASRRHFAEYIKQGLRRPRWWVEDRSPRKCATPFWLQLQVTMMRELGMPFGDVMEMPVSQAIWLCAVLWEASGTLELMSDDDSDLFESGFVIAPVFTPRRKAEAN